MSATTQDAARRYIERGFAPIPVPAGSKNPNRADWESERWSAEDVPEVWNNGQNIGLLTGEPSGWLVDVDLDSPEAARIAECFLPPTLTSGRASSPDSHRWYASPGTEYGEWKDTDRKKIVELRGTGRQTLVEPSNHTSGEAYSWSQSGLEIAPMDASALRARCTELATATLIARHLPEHRDAGGGGRHDYAMALAGFLLRPGRLNEDLTLKVLVAAWDAKGWASESQKREAHRDLEGVVGNTAENIEADEPVVGGPTLEEMVPGMVRLLRSYWGWRKEEQGQDTAAEEKEERRNQADRLIGYALEGLEELFVDQHGAPHALVRGEPVPLTSRCYPWLRKLMWEQEKKAVNGEYLKTAVGTLAAHAEFSGEARELHTRAAWQGDTLYYELRPGWVVRCSASGWGFEDKPPVLLRRFPNLKDLPDPEPEDSLDVLDTLVNLKTERDRRLFKAYLATVALPHVPRPILIVEGAMGSGKTTIGRMVKRTWDPGAPETVRYDARDILQKALHAYILMFDNLNALSESAADTCCRLVTGEADSKRKLYTDDEDVIVEVRRAVILNGINIPTDRSDVLDRSLVVELERIPDAERETEERLWERFEAERPRLLGTLFSVLARAIALKPSLQLSRRPRLADWGEYAAAVYEVMGWGAETFLEDWDEVVKAQNQATLDGSPVAQAVIKFMEDKFMEDKQEYVASSSELHKKLGAVAEDLGVDRDKAWPKSASWLWKRIKEVLPVLSASRIVAVRIEDKKGSRIALRKAPTDAATTATEEENGTDKGETGGSKEDAAATDAATDEDAATEKGRFYGESGSTGGSGSKSGAKSEPLSADLNPGESATLEELKAGREDQAVTGPENVRKLLKDPPGWLRHQIEHARGQGFPESQLKALAAAVASEACGDGTKGAEILPAVEAFLTHGVGCGCEECA